MTPKRAATTILWPHTIPQYEVSFTIALKNIELSLKYFESFERHTEPVRVILFI